MSSIASAPVTVTWAGKPVDDDRAAVADDADMIVGVAAVDGDRVRRAVAMPPWRRQIDRDLLHIGAGQIVDDDIVGAAQGVELNAFDAVEVHRDVGDVTGEQRPRAVRRDVDVLVDVGAVEQQRIEAALALDHIAAVARVPDERVVAASQKRHVVAATADDGVVSVAGEQGIRALAADDRVVAGAAVDRQLGQAGDEARGVDHIVPRASADDDIFDAVGLDDDIADAGHRGTLSVCHHADRIGGVGAVDLQRVEPARPLTTSLS